MTTAHDYAQEHAADFRQQLYEWLRIPSVSTHADYAPQVRKAADWLVAHLENIGLSVELIEVDGQHPIVYAENLNAGVDAKTVLVYGHYDVQPAVKADGWESEPFDPIEVDGFMVARGSSDDKGQAFTHIKAVESLLKTQGKLPVNIKFIIEGEEESGSEALTTFVRDNAEKLAADVCVISDSSMSVIESPVIINSLRGAVTFEMVVTGPKQDLHSGMYGGTVHNPAQAIAEIIAQLHNDDGSVAVNGFYDDVRDLTDEDRETINQIEWDNVTWSEETGAKIPWGESNYSLRERVGARPTLEINGIASGYFDKGLKAIVPHQAIAKCSCRLVADQDPDDIMQKIEKFIKKITPPSVEIEISQLDVHSPPALIDTDNPAMQAAIAAYTKGWGAAPIFMREGGSIPIVADFQKVVGLPVILMGFGLDTDNIHGPNEQFSIEMFHKGIDTSIHFLQEMAMI